MFFKKAKPQNHKDILCDMICNHIIRGNMEVKKEPTRNIYKINNSKITVFYITHTKPYESSWHISVYFGDSVINFSDDQCQRIKIELANFSNNEKLKIKMQKETDEMNLALSAIEDLISISNN